MENFQRDEIFGRSISIEHPQDRHYCKWNGKAQRKTDENPEWQRKRLLKDEPDRLFQETPHSKSLGYKDKTESLKLQNKKRNNGFFLQTKHFYFYFAFNLIGGGKLKNGGFALWKEESMMNSIKEKECQQILEAAVVTQEEIDLACEEFTPQDQREKAKEMTSKILFKYSGFLGSVSQEDKIEIVRTLGPQIASLEEKLAKLQEAPE